MEHKLIKIVFSVILCDAGEATRALQIAGGIKELCPENYNLEIIFLSTGSSFEGKVISEGYTIYKCRPSLPGIGFHQDYKPTTNNIIGDEKLAQEMLNGEIEALNALNPDIVIYGFNPIAGLARRMTNKKIPGISYLPIPLCREMITTDLMNDIPDMAKPLTYLPKFIRKRIMKLIPKSIKIKAPTLKQCNIRKALSTLNWPSDEKNIENLLDMLKADLTIINDFREFYEGHTLPDNIKITGPLFAPPFNFNPIDEKILEVFNKSKQSNKHKIFCSLGSSGKKQFLIEVLKALDSEILRDKVCAVVLAPPSVCCINDAISYVKNNKDIYVTDKFVPATIVNALADITLCHGGQGTLQTAVYSKTPIIGFAMQAEQQINLDNIVKFGGAVRIPIHMWNKKNIIKAILKISNEDSYEVNISNLSEILETYDGKKNAAETIWNYITTKLAL